MHELQNGDLEISRSCDPPPCRRWAMPLPDTTTQWRLGPVTGCHWLWLCGFEFRWCFHPPAIEVCHRSWGMFHPKLPKFETQIFRFRNPWWDLRMCYRSGTPTCRKTHVVFFCPASSSRNSGDPFTCHALTVVRNGAWPSNTKMSGISNARWWKIRAMVL